MLKRKMTAFLNRWRHEKRQECLLIKGARQVGKTYIVNEFGSSYESFISIDFIQEPSLKAVFSGALTSNEIFQQLSLLLPGVRIVAGNTLLFLDEIQECPEARTALKYLAADDRCDVIASGSLLGIEYRQHDPAIRTSIPVGYERQVEMHPLDFEEFLWALGYDESATQGLASFVQSPSKIPAALNEAMMKRVREYLAIGGMPEVVQTFVDTQHYGEMFKVQSKLLQSYLDDIARYATPVERVKARASYLSLPRQLAKENTKFQYSVVESRGTARKFSDSIEWLEGVRMVVRCRAVSTPQFPLAAYEDGSKFRLYANDTGLLMAMYGFEMLAAVVENTLVGPMKGGLYENLVAGMLAKQGVPLRYWMSSKGDREIEFLLERNAAPVPVEVKASRGSTVSLNDMLARDDVSVGYKLIDGNAGVDGKKITLPLYLGAFIASSSRGV